MKAQFVIFGFGMLISSFCFAEQNLTCSRSYSAHQAGMSGTMTESATAMTRADGSLFYFGGFTYKLLPSDQDALPYTDKWGYHTSRDGVDSGLMMGSVTLKMTVTAEATAPGRMTVEISDPAHGRSITNVFRPLEHQNFHFPVDLTIPQENAVIHYDCTLTRSSETK